MNKASEPLLRAIKKYDAENAVRMSFKFNKKHDADVLDKLNKVASKQGYIKSLIRADIAKGKTPQ